MSINIAMAAPLKNSLRWANTALSAAASAIAVIMMRRAMRKAYRDLAALDDRMLADIGIARSEIASLMDMARDARQSVRRVQRDCD
jgi:uncharacterized protein YjiS (DUF1127 family)